MTADVVDYRNDADGLTAEQLAGGFFAGWPWPPEPAVHLQLLRGSDLVALAVERESSRVVGFATAVTDGVLCAFLPLLEVLPEHRGRGIGSTLARRVLARLDHLYAVDLLCDEELVAFWSRFGLRRLTGMAARRPEAIPTSADSVRRT